MSTDAEYTAKCEASKARVKESVDRWFRASADGLDRPRKKRQYAGSEASEQAKLAAWLDRNGILWAHPANERKATVRQYARLAGQGVKAGLPDVLIFSRPPKADLVSTSQRAPMTPPRGIAIELKRLSSKATVSVAQLDWLEKLRAEGWLAKVCVGSSEAIHWLESLGFGQ